MLSRDRQARTNQEEDGEMSVDTRVTLISRRCIEPVERSSEGMRGP
jgi:hypothetical protein